MTLDEKYEMYKAKIGTIVTIPRPNGDAIVGILKSVEKRPDIDECVLSLTNSKLITRYYEKEDK